MKVLNIDALRNGKHEILLTDNGVPIFRGHIDILKGSINKNDGIKVYN
jgi:hypothetical protein